jgi:hypothetical protein
MVERGVVISRSVVVELYVMVECCVREFQCE